MAIDTAKAETIIRSLIVARVDRMGDEMVKDLKDEISDPKGSRPTINGWPLRRDTGALKASVADEVTKTEDGVQIVIGRGMKWYGAYWELTGRHTRKGFRKYPWFWRTWRKYLQKYMAILGVTGSSGLSVGVQNQNIGGGEKSDDRARQSWRKTFWPGRR